MIKKGFNVGDIFTDGGRRFKVIRVLENGDYISEAVNSDREDDLDKAVGSGTADNADETADSGMVGGDDPVETAGTDMAGNPDKAVDSGTADNPGEMADSGTADDLDKDSGREDVNLNTGRYTKRQIQRMSKADTYTLAGELGIVVSGTTTEIKEAILRNLGL